MINAHYKQYKAASDSIRMRGFRGTSNQRNRLTMERVTRIELVV
jgi:hypothetical protein